MPEKPHGALRGIAATEDEIRARDASSEIERVHLIPLIGDWAGPCDWGDCDELAVTKRWSSRHGWLPVCEAHQGS